MTEGSVTGELFRKGDTKMIDSRSQYIIHKEKETALMHQIERKLAAQERGEPAKTSQPWYSTAEQWLKEIVFARSSANRDCCPEEGAA
jgi:hypothetical protein